MTSTMFSRIAPPLSLRTVLLGAAVAVTASAPWWGPPALSGLTYFRVRHVQIAGVRYASASAIYAKLQVDTSSSVWQELDAMEARVEELPQIANAEIERDLPGTLVVYVWERQPVAMVATPTGMLPLDSAGVPLAIDPGRADTDLPILATRDTTLVRLLSTLRGSDPGIFARISEARRVGKDQLLFVLPPIRVRAMQDVTAARFADILPVEADLARRTMRVKELDLRFRDQVIARVE
ncbi:MAG: FtsQ-type POTRA domain-containing protein [Anaerolineae bacterium]|nr:FtsQ-type POTRA domain-containing protein [Gemmatimonadaceae bacterium]